MSTSLYSKTPSVTVVNNRSLTIRDIGYHRHPDTPDSTDERITRYTFDARGFLTQRADPRLHQSGLNNFIHLNDLTGTVLRTQSADSGTTTAVSDTAGRPFMAVNNVHSADVLAPMI